MAPVELKRCQIVPVVLAIIELCLSETSVENSTEEFFFFFLNFVPTYWKHSGNTEGTVQYLGTWLYPTTSAKASQRYCELVNLFLKSANLHYP